MDSELRAFPVWAAPVSQEKIRRLYETDAKGIYDEELIDEVGYALLARCESFIAANEVMWGKLPCPRCAAKVPHGQNKEEVLRCPCGWELTWGVQAMAAGDLDGNGTDDLAVALSGGEVHCYLSGLFRVFGVRVKLPAGTAGPVTVSAWQAGKLPVCTGTWSICDPAQPVLFSVRSPGRRVLRYQLPGQPVSSCEVLVGEEPPLVTLPVQPKEAASHGTPTGQLR